MKYTISTIKKFLSDKSDIKWSHKHPIFHANLKPLNHSPKLNLKQKTTDSKCGLASTQNSREGKNISQFYTQQSHCTALIIAEYEKVEEAKC